MRLTRRLGCGQQGIHGPGLSRKRLDMSEESAVTLCGPAQQDREELEWLGLRPSGLLSSLVASY